MISQFKKGSFSLVFVFSSISGALPHSTCERKFEKIGCFVDNTGQQGALRTLPVLLVNDRDPTSDAYDGHRLDWHKWPESIHRFEPHSAYCFKYKITKIVRTF